MTCVIFGKDNEQGGRIWALCDSRISTSAIGEYLDMQMHLYFDMCPKLLMVQGNGCNFLLAFSGNSILPLVVRELAIMRSVAANNVGELVAVAKKFVDRLLATPLPHSFLRAPIQAPTIVICGRNQTMELEAWTVCSDQKPRRAQLAQPYAIGDEAEKTNKPLLGKDFAGCKHFLTQWIADDVAWPSIGGPMLIAEMTTTGGRHLSCELLQDLALI